MADGYTIIMAGQGGREAGNAKSVPLVKLAGRTIMLPQKHAGPVAHGTRPAKKRTLEKPQPGERTAAQIRFENEQSHERIRQVDKWGRHQPAPPDDSTDTRRNPGTAHR